jgi:hypothetical protein
MAAKRTPSSLDGLTFYMVPSSWMVKAWPMLDARPTTVVSSTRDDYGKWRENVGVIQSRELLSTNHTVSSDEEGTENGNRKPSSGTTQQLAPQSVSLRTDLNHGVALRADLKHGIDYFLLGPSAWLLVKEKFGFDKEIGRPCVSTTTNDNTLSVAVYTQQPANGGAPNNQAAQHSLIPIPPAGYFHYQQLLSDLEGDSEETFLPQPAHRQAPELFEPQQHAQDTTQTTVSDDEGGENDLVRSYRVQYEGAMGLSNLAFSSQYPDPDAMVVSNDFVNAAQHESQGPVILLPPSTTVSPASSNNDDSLYPSVQDMECGDQADEAKEDPTEDGVTTATVVPVVIASSHRIYGSGLGNLGT